MIQSVIISYLRRKIFIYCFVSLLLFPSLFQEASSQDTRSNVETAPVGAGNVVRDSSKGFKSSYNHQTIHSGFHSSGAYSRGITGTPWWKISLIALLVVVVLIVIIFLCAMWSRNINGETSEREAAVTAYLRNHQQQQA